MEMSKTLDEFRVGSVPTVFYFPDFITESEHHHLLKTIYDAPISKWKSLTNRRLQNWGGVVHEKGLIAQDLPPWLTRITERINEKSRLFPSSINHVLINEYLPNQGIMPHQDGPAYYPVVAILSLGSPVVIDFTPHPNLSCRVGAHGNSAEDKISDQEASVMNSCEWLDNFHPFSIILLPRSLLIFKDMVYSDYLHGIKDSEVQGCNGAVNVTDVQNHGVVWHSSGSVKGFDSDDTVICRANTRVSLTCRVVTKGNFRFYYLQNYGGLDGICAFMNSSQTFTSLIARSKICGLSYQSANTHAQQPRLSEVTLDPIAFYREK